MIFINFLLYSSQLLLEQIAGPRAKDDFLREAKVMAGLDHPCIVKLVGVCEGPPLMLVQVDSNATANHVMMIDQ